MNTSDKLKKFDDNGSHKNGTVTGSEHKIFSNSKDPDAKKGRNRSESHGHESEKPEDTDHKHDDETKDEVTHKGKSKCPKLPPKCIDCMNKILENGIFITFMMI